ncbi:MAG: exopolysaccharide biosynthesis polyprenyl glycosylphosphotransferase [Bacteroidota bacterium]
MIILTTIILTFILALFTTPLIRKVALKLQIGDYPSARKIHTSFIPRLGGIGFIVPSVLLIIAAIIWGKIDISLPLMNGIFLFLSFFVIIITGLLDDILGLGSLVKLLGQTISAVLIYFAGFSIESINIPFIANFQLGILSFPITLLWVVGITNAINLIDGLDGLAAGISVIVGTVFFFIALYFNHLETMIVSAALVGGLIGFLRYNFYPSTIFMGDVGSLFLGLVLSFISLKISKFALPGEPTLSFVIVIIALAVPISDTAIAFFRRLKRGMHPLKADKEHIHHRLLDLGLTHRQTVLVIYSIAVFSGLIALLIVYTTTFYSFLLLCVFLVATLLGIKRLGYIEELRRSNINDIRSPAPITLANILDKSITVFIDIIALNLAFFATYSFRFSSGLVPMAGYVPFYLYIIEPSILLLTVSWIVLFALSGLYQMSWDYSRIDFVISLLKTVSVGIILLFIISLDSESVSIASKSTLVVYYFSIIIFVSTGRFIINYIGRKYEILGFVRRSTVIVGTNDIALKLYQNIIDKPQLKYNVIGFVNGESNTKIFENKPVLGTFHEIDTIIKQYKVEEVLIASSVSSYDDIVEIISRCSGLVRSIKIAPNLSSFFTGFKTEQIFGFPLIRIFPLHMKTWQWMIKRLIDIFVAFLILIPFLPIWILVSILIKLDSEGPIFFKQERVGKNGFTFNLYKFRSMIKDAEKKTGPVWAVKDDKRITRIGKFLRKARLDEIPQFINVLKGQMSLVGPRPERLFFVEKFRNEIGFYPRRLLIRPGITGWAQVKHRYDLSIDDVKEKLRYDLYYLENMSLTLDYKIIFRTFLVSISGKGTH